MTSPSRYASIWNQLKLNNKVRISAPAEGHKRLKKAIIKRKDLDLSYKFSLGEQNKVAKLEFESSGSILSVRLYIKHRSDWI